MTFTRTVAFRFRLLLLVLLTTAAVVSAQSVDPTTPTPIHKDNLLGRIPARDLGDARLTNHYYAFRGTPGDLLITIQSRNLNGDIDVFTAGTLRPLLKLTLYAESTAPITKGIYLRKTEDLVLRVQARSPNDEEGTYQFVFGGSFQPIEGSDVAETETPGTPSTGTRPGGGRRASSVGARIDEPPPPLTDVATVPALPDPTPTPSPVETPKPAVTETPTAVAPERPAPRTARNRPPARTTPRTTPTTRRTTTTPKPTETPVETSKREEPADSAAEPKAKPPSRTTSRRTTKTTAATPSAEPKTEPATEAKPEAESGPRLIIETNDGTLINRSMSGVRRVTVENGVVLVIAKNGKIDRILLANVVKMSIEP
ncbi:MAG TPA: hypothetical protein VLA93_09485, partial [Pyrinomonadaceae bacterium]|nr:hypothetical protein [Pyrinomonadaceae bacterium]